MLSISNMLSQDILGLKFQTCQRKTTFLCITSLLQQSFVLEFFFHILPSSNVLTFAFFCSNPTVNCAEIPKIDLSKFKEFSGVPQAIPQAVPQPTKRTTTPYSRYASSTPHSQYPSGVRQPRRSYGRRSRRFRSRSTRGPQQRYYWVPEILYQ